MEIIALVSIGVNVLLLMIKYIIIVDAHLHLQCSFYILISKDPFSHGNQKDASPCPLLCFSVGQLYVTYVIDFGVTLIKPVIKT